MPADENARLIAFYNAARAEIVQRLTLREQVVLAYLASSGVIAGMAYKAGVSLLSPVLYIIPLMSIGFTLEFLRHEWVIANLGDYLHRELDSNLDVEIHGSVIRDWDRSQNLGRRLWFHLVLEKGLSFALIIAPALAAELLANQNSAPGYHYLRTISYWSLGASAVVMFLEWIRVALMNEPSSAAPAQTRAIPPKLRRRRVMAASLPDSWRSRTIRRYQVG